MDSCGNYIRDLPSELQWKIEKFRLMLQIKRGKLAVLREILGKVQKAEPELYSNTNTYWFLTHKEKWEWRKAQIYYHNVAWCVSWEGHHRLFYPESSVLEPEYDDLDIWHLQTTYYPQEVESYRRSTYVLHIKHPSTPEIKWEYKMWPDEYRVRHPKFG